MNKQIKKLAEQAGIPSLWTVGTDKQGNPILEKFSELIVKECGVALSPMLRDMVSRGQAFDLIKEHFGVEE